jgi:integrase
MVWKAINGCVEASVEELFWTTYDEFYVEKAQLCRPSTAIKYKSLQKLLKAFESAKYPMSFEAVTKRWHADFRLYCISLGYLNNTTNKYIKMVKGFMNWSSEMKYHDNLDFKRFRIEFETTETIALTIEELKAIEDFDPRDNKYMETARDIFLVGVYSAQRVSDLMAMKKKDLKIQADGEMWWDVHQIKGRKLVRVYMVNKARDILNKYLTDKNANDFVFPRQSPEVTNRNLKKIGKGAGLIVLVSKINYCGHAKKEVTEPKYFFLSMHTARRTAVSLMCFSSMPDHLIQNISGHSSSKEALVYKSIDRVKIRDGLINLFDPKDIAKTG